ncbi:ribonuclease P protein subunit p29-like [Lingula anatina]|uniref:Ribonuclease P protein subunit p29 n=1 Tax=Lingula anatina TaxID=7574 RepID=A0A2R2MRE7_LINAN|nr:ribonuclease P protein subunit p29-like [Lingula anatina]|eukprot:XP_023932718.1 ribonuclease P protein subunit p29-like [Lingula anatina]
MSIFAKKNVSKAEKNEFVQSFLQKHLPEKRLRQGEDITLQHAHFMLDNPRTRKRKEVKLKRKTLSAKERKELKLFEIQPEHQKYDMYTPLHQLWKDYMKDVINFDKITPGNQSQMEELLLRADLHGAVLTVTKSKCPSYVGTSGILIQETKNTFKLITKDDRLKTIPKPNSVFTFELEGYIITIYGNNFQVRASERAHRKFKTRPTVDLI